MQMSGLEAGDRVLVHTASGGVGLAAIQMVHAAGAEVFATASAPKQDYLRSLGIAHVFDSRSSRFQQRGSCEATGGAGVDRGAEQPDRTGLHRGESGVPGFQGGRFVEMGRSATFGRRTEIAAVRDRTSPTAVLHGGRAQATRPGDCRRLPQACHGPSGGG